MKYGTYRHEILVEGGEYMELHGLCVSKGDATGIIKIIDSKNAETHYSSPTIIVMKKLDRKFLVEMDESIVGVIAEDGNIGSHGAGILRQLKIPCILRIKDATKILVNNSIASMYGLRACIECQTIAYTSNYSLPSTSSKKLSYKKISKDFFDIHDIQAINKWTCPRPDRIYQELRYSIMSDVFASSGHFLFGLPMAKVGRNSDGAIIVYGLPSVEDVCSFLLCSPSWLIQKSKERTIEFNKIKHTLRKLESQLNENDLNVIYSIFKECVELYKSIFKYAFTSQAISDELLELYIDFYNHLGLTTTKDILHLKSKYVEQCISSGIDPGVSQKWVSQKAVPHIWDGYIDYTPLEIESILQDRIDQTPDNRTIQRDYKSFRVIIPLVYQLSEEYFYVSSSINSFINWSITMVCKVLNNKGGYNRDINYYYSLPLSDFSLLIENHLQKGV